MIISTIQIAKTTIDLTIDPIAALALLTATASLVVSIIAIVRDRPKIRIRFREGWILINPMPGYEEDIPYFSVSVSNRGTRPLSINNVAAKYLKENDGFTLLDSMIYGARRLTQGESMDCLMKMEDFEKHKKKEGIAGVQVTDLTGKTYYKPYSPFYIRLPYWLIRSMKK